MVSGSGVGRHPNRVRQDLFSGELVSPHPLFNLCVVGHRHQRFRPAVDLPRFLTLCTNLTRTVLFN